MTQEQTQESQEMAELLDSMSEFEAGFYQEAMYERKRIAAMVAEDMATFYPRPAKQASEPTHQWSPEEQADIDNCPF